MLNNINYNKQDGYIYNCIKTLIININIIIMALFAIIIIIYKSDKLYIKGLFTLIFLQFWSYFIHKYAHSDRKSYIYYLHSFHHLSSCKNTINKNCSELFLNLVLIGGGIIIPLNIMIMYYFNFELFNNYIILFWLLEYTEYHIFNYHILNSPTHKQHHSIDENPNKTCTNYGPDWMDILFETKCDIDVFEDYTSSIFNTIINLIIILLLLIYYY